MLDYTRKVGETSAIKKLFDFLNSQQSVMKDIEQKQNNKVNYAIGEDHTFDQLREELQKKKEVK